MSEEENIPETQDEIEKELAEIEKLKAKNEARLARAQAKQEKAKALAEAKAEAAEALAQKEAEALRIFNEEKAAKLSALAEEKKMAEEKLKALDAELEYEVKIAPIRVVVKDWARKFESLTKKEITRYIKGHPDDDFVDYLESVKK